MAEAGQGAPAPRKLNPLVRRAIVTAIVLAIAVAAFWPEWAGLGFGGPPVEDGTRLVFKTVEQTGASTRRYGTQLRFTLKDDKTFRLDIMTQQGVNSLDVFASNLDPTADPDNEPLQFPAVEEGVEVTPGLLWLPPSHRQAGMNTVSGQVMGIGGLGQWRVWKVLHAEGEVYYEVETGLLAGFDLLIARTRVTARLRAIRGI